MKNLVRVLVVDDSAFARKVLRDVLSTSPFIDVVGTARDGLDALEKIAELKPDVITLDLVMPNLDGLGVLRALPASGAPRVVVVSMNDEQSDLGVEALATGAFDLVHKPTALALNRLYELSAELIDKVKAAGFATSPEPSAPPSLRPAPAPAPALGPSDRLVVIGTSTGGPQALTQLLRGFPRDFPAPIALVLHIPQGYTESLARRLDHECAIDVVEASEGLALRPGLAIVARAGIHMKLRSSGDGCVAVLDPEPRGTIHRPSVNVLFESAAKLFGARTLAAVLTGMGDDGLIGSRAIHAAGGLILTEAAASCVVYGMPRVVREAGLSAGEARIEDMADAIIARL